MKKLDLSLVPKKLKPHPIFKGMSKRLKDPSNYLEIEKRLQDILKSDHQHKTVTAYVKCEECQKNRVERQSLMKKEGFKSIQQYMEWKKIHQIIINKRDFPIR